nr:CTP synthase-like [Ipomoea batatas]
MVEQLEAAGLCFTGKDESGRRMEIFELSNHSYFVGVQFHPEFKSRPGKPSALFVGSLIAAASGQLNGLLKKSASGLMSNGHSPIKPQQHECGTKLANGIHCNGNGVHI